MSVEQVEGHLLLSFESILDCLSSKVLSSRPNCKASAHGRPDCATLMELSELTQARRIMRTFDVIVFGLGGMGSVIGEVVREMFLNDKTTLDISPFGIKRFDKSG